jgi:hypothetical protein
MISLCYFKMFMLKKSIKYCTVTWHCTELTVLLIINNLNLYSWPQIIKFCLYKFRTLLILNRLKKEAHFLQPQKGSKLSNFLSR